MPFDTVGEGDIKGSRHTIQTYWRTVFSGHIGINDLKKDIVYDILVFVQAQSLQHGIMQQTQYSLKNITTNQLTLFLYVW